MWRARAAFVRSEITVVIDMAVAVVEKLRMMRL